MELRVVVKINAETAPELFDEINAIPARLRAERMRMLATMGTAVFSGRAIPAGRGASSFPQPVSVPDSGNGLSPLKGLKMNF